jgi:hypothetical protein
MDTRSIIESNMIKLRRTRTNKELRVAYVDVEQRRFEDALLLHARIDKNKVIRPVPILFGYKIQTDRELLQLRNEIRLTLPYMIRLLFGVDTILLTRLDEITPLRIVDRVLRLLLFRLDRTQRQDAPIPSL